MKHCRSQPSDVTCVADRGLVCLVMEIVLNSGAQCAQRATGGKQRHTELLSEVAKRGAIPNASCLGYTIEIIRRDQLDIYGKGQKRF